MELELDTLDLRYERLRRVEPRREKRLLASLAEIGQQLPILVVASADAVVVVDGYKRVRALRKLGREMILAARWELGEAEAVMLEGLMRSGGGDGPLDRPGGCGNCGTASNSRAWNWPGDSTSR